MEVVQFFIELGYRVKIDSLLSIVFHRPIIDIFDFDYQVHKKFDPENNYSLEYLLNKYYDPEIIEKIKYFSGAKEQVVKMTKYEMNKELTKAKELLTKWVELFKPKVGNIPPTPIQIETEQFINGVKNEKTILQFEKNTFRKC